MNQAHRVSITVGRPAVANCCCGWQVFAVDAEDAASQFVDHIAKTYFEHGRRSVIRECVEQARAAPTCRMEPIS